MNAILRGLFPLAGIGVVFAGVIIILFPAPCAMPLTYSIGELDPRFGLSKEVFLKDIQQAESVWEAAGHKNLFEYDPTSTFTINLTYDERQAIVDKAKIISGSLANTSQAHTALLQQYQSAHTLYERAFTTYQQHLDQFNTDVAQYRADEVQKLNQEQQAFAVRFSALEDERLKLNVLALNVNKLANTEGQIVKTYNQTVRQFNTEFSNGKEFDQGEYTGHAITIYEFTKHNDLLLVLTHEMGHALGIEHVQNPSAVMYYMVNAKNLAAKGLASDDISALRMQCSKSSFQVFWERLMAFASNAKKGV